MENLLSTKALFYDTDAYFLPFTLLDYQNQRPQYHQEYPYVNKKTTYCKETIKGFNETKKCFLIGKMDF